MRKQGLDSDLVSFGNIGWPWQAGSDEGMTAKMEGTFHRMRCSMDKG